MTTERAWEIEAKILAWETETKGSFEDSFYSDNLTQVSEAVGVSVEELRQFYAYWDSPERLKTEEGWRAHGILDFLSH